MAIAMQGVLLYAHATGQDLTGKLFFFAKVDGNGNIVLAGAGDPAIGTVVEEGTLGAPASVQLNGIAKVLANGAITPGSRVQAHGTGQAIVIGAGVALGVYIGEANAVAGNVISIKLY